MKNRSWIAPTLLGLSFLAAAAVLSLAEDAPAGRTDGDAAGERRVRIAEVTAETAERALVFPGVVRAVDRATLSFPVAARLIERPVRLGDRVAAGQLLARLETAELGHRRDDARGAIGEAEARLAQARNDARRSAELAAAKAATREELERSDSAVAALEAVVEGARARLAEAERRLGETALRAPFAGTVTAVAAEPGETLAAGQPVLELAGDGRLEVEVHVPESLTGMLVEGAAASVRLPLAGAAAPDAVVGRVVRIGRAAGSAGGLFPVRIELDGAPGLVPGLAAEVSFHTAPTREVTVPLAAVLNPGADRPHVFRVIDGQVVRTAVDVAALAGDRVAVRGELAAGDRVVITGQTSLVDGDRVEVIR